MPSAHINIGSNQGDRLGYINRAVALINILAGKVAGRSGVIESEPWGFESSNRFLNEGINIDTPLGPLELLERLQTIQTILAPDPHRNIDGSYRDRSVDIDIIDYEGVVMDTPKLTIPHPHLRERDFFLKPYEAMWTKDKGL